MDITGWPGPLHCGEKPALIGVTGVGFEEADIGEVSGVEADEAAGAFDLNGDSGRGIRNDLAGFVNDVNFEKFQFA